MAALSLVPDIGAQNTPRNPWERQPTDTDKSWRAFTTYRDLGPDRSYTGVCTALGIRDRHWIQSWSVRHNWRQRAAAYDADLDEQLQKKILAKRWKVAENASQIADAFLTRVVQRLRTVDVTALDMTDLVAMTRLAVGIQRDVHFPRADTGVQVNAIAQIIVDPMLIPPPTAEPTMIVDADD